MRVLGLGTQKDAGAAVVEDGRILAAVNEERPCRLKLAEGFPRESISEVLGLTGTGPGELDAVLVAGREDRFIDDVEAADGWFEGWGHGDPVSAVIKRAAGRVSRFGNRFPILQALYYAALTPGFAYRRRRIRRILRREFGVRCPIRFVDHHFCHVASAAFTAGFPEALVVSLDGGGDGRSGLVHAFREGEFEYLAEVSGYHSLGNFYAYVTHLCGFEAQKHEGKITGLSARGEPRHLPLLRELIQERDGTFRNESGLVFMGAVRELERRLPDGWTREDLAASIQAHFEELVGRFVSHWRQRTGLRDVALAGGVFANVVVNQRVHELPGVDRVFVHPGMTDGGLPVGAALAACAPGVLERRMARDAEPLRDAYLGPTIREEEVARALRGRGLRPEPLKGPIEEAVAELLARGHVVARAAGRMEYGPRALGHRSILYRPDDPSVNDWLNRRLERTEFMPFAPAVLHEERGRCFEDVDGAAHAAEFMTITLDCTPWMAENMPGAVHLDGTARPQLVRRESSPGFHRILRAFRRRTGLPGVINTSFNMHEEPIAMTAEDCVRAFLRSGLDYLAVGPVLVRHPRAREEAGAPGRRRVAVGSGPPLRRERPRVPAPVASSRPERAGPRGGREG